MTTDEKLPAARELMSELDGLPSLRQLMARVGVGQDRARTLRGVLVAEALSDTGMADRSGTVSDNGEIPAIEASPVAANSPITDTAEAHPDTPQARRVRGRAHRAWPVLVVALPAFVAVWSGWVGLGQLAGFGVMHPLPGIADGVQLDTAITLPIGLEAYAVLALGVWLSTVCPARARRFAAVSACVSLLVGAAGQVGYHLLSAAGARHAPWPITTAVSVLPVVVLGMAAALIHLIRTGDTP